MLAGILHWIGFGLCHQLPARSFSGGGLQVPVCARDTGIYLGFLVSVAVIAATGGRRVTEFPRTSRLLLAAVFLLAMVADGVSSYAGWRTTTNDLRLITGLLAGFAIPVLLMPLLNDQLWAGRGGLRPLDSPSQLAAWGLAVPASFAIVRWGMPMLGVAYPVLVALAVLATFTAVNLVLVAMLPPFERRIRAVRHLLLPLLLAGGLTFVELAASNALKAFLLG